MLLPRIHILMQSFMFVVLLIERLVLIVIEMVIPFPGILSPRSLVPAQIP